MTTPGRDGWWKRVAFGLHYDLHAGAADTQLGAELTHEHLREQLQKVAPDFVQCDCKGHPGYASWPTRVGSPSPGIVRDALRIHRDVTRDLGIPLSVHYSGIWDSRAVELHPEWAALDCHGEPIQPRANDSGIVCPRGPYLHELMIPQMIELIDRYDVDGFWVDGDNWAVRDCYCERCRAEFLRRTGLDTPPETQEHEAWPTWRAFQRDTFVEYVRQYVDAVHAHKPSCAVCSNWMYSMRQPGEVTVSVDYLSGDFTPSFGCERAEMEGRYIDGHGMPWNLMAWAFCRPSQELPWQIKSVTHLCQESAEVLSCGGAVFIYNQPQRSGWLTAWHQDILAEVARFCRAREAFSLRTESVPEAAVLLSDGHVWAHNPMPFCLGESHFGAEGALHLLVENQYHVDVLDDSRLLARMDRYALIVVGEQEKLTDEMLAALEGYAAAGGIVLMSGEHLATMCPRLVGVEAAGELVAGNWYLPVDGECAALAGPWQPVRMTDSVAGVSIMTNQQPGKDETAYPAVTMREIGKGRILAVHGRIMRAYYLSHQPRLRRFAAELLKANSVQRRVEVSSSPSIEVTLRRGDGFLAVHVVNRAVNPTLTDRLHLVEEVPPAKGVAVRVRVEDRPRQVTLEPGARRVDWRYADGWLSTQLERVHVHEILVIRG